MRVDIEGGAAAPAGVLPLDGDLMAGGAQRPCGACRVVWDPREFADALRALEAGGWRMERDKPLLFLNRICAHRRALAALGARGAGMGRMRAVGTDGAVFEADLARPSKDAFDELLSSLDVAGTMRLCGGKVRTSAKGTSAAKEGAERFWVPMPPGFDTWCLGDRGFADYVRDNLVPAPCKSLFDAGLSLFSQPARSAQAPAPARPAARGRVDKSARNIGNRADFGALSGKHAVLWFPMKKGFGAICQTPPPQRESPQGRCGWNLCLNPACVSRGSHTPLDQFV